ncbi:MAG: hypothetical protein M3Y91_19545 [Actinomycetota bacterium]|nr:hypothetical protein [Actinomycetota bacterium]
MATAGAPTASPPSQPSPSPPWSATNIVATAVAAGIAACTGGAELSRRLRHAGPILCVPFGALFGYATARWVHPGWWPIAGVAVPYLSPLLGDTITPGGVPWLLPATQPSGDLSMRPNR